MSGHAVGCRGSKGYRLVTDPSNPRLRSTLQLFHQQRHEMPRPNTFAWLSGLRGASEQCFQETRAGLGMDQYGVHMFPRWHHHIISCSLALFFLWHLKIRMGKKLRPLFCFSLGCCSRFLPMRPQTLETLIEQIIWIQNRNHRARFSHRKRYLLEVPHAI